MAKLSGFDSQEKFGCAVIGLVLVLFLVVTGLKAGGGLNYEYSDGSRSGVVQKISRKGIVFKTWEGELNLGYSTSKSTDSGTTINPAIFYFSVTNADVVKQIQDAEQSGERVTLEYKQYFLRGWAQGQTAYDIVGVKRMPKEL